MPLKTTFASGGQEVGNNQYELCCLFNIFANPPDPRIRSFIFIHKTTREKNAIIRHTSRNFVPRTRIVRVSTPHYGHHTPITDIIIHDYSNFRKCLISALNNSCRFAALRSHCERSVAIQSCLSFLSDFIHWIAAVVTLPRNDNGV